VGRTEGDVVEVLVQLKDYLADRPETAFLALTLVALFYMFRKYDKAREAHLVTLSSIAPLADKLCYIISKVKKKTDNGGE